MLNEKKKLGLFVILIPIIVARVSAKPQLFASVNKAANAVERLPAGHEYMFQQSCTNDTECKVHQKCILAGQEPSCLNPCLGYCGFGAICTVVNHEPICWCPTCYEGNPTEKCTRILGHRYWSCLFLRVEITETKP